MAAVPTNQNVRATIETMAAHINLSSSGTAATVAPARFITIALQRAPGRGGSQQRGISPPDRIPYSLRVTKAPTSPGAAAQTQSSDMLLTNERGEIELPESLIARADSNDETIVTIFGSEISLRRSDLVNTLPGTPTAAATQANDLRNGCARLANLGYLHGTFTMGISDPEIELRPDHDVMRQAILHFQADKVVGIDGVLADILAALQTAVGE